MIVHLNKHDGSKTFCGRAIIYVSGDGSIGPDEFVSRRSSMENGINREANCELCIDAWETHPIAVDTADLANVMSILVELMKHPHDRRVAIAAEDLLEKLQRPCTYVRGP